MEKFIIQGGKPLRGAVRVGGAKNASFKLMIASLLAKGESRLLDIPQIGDVETTREVIKSLGGKVAQRGERTVFINPESLNSFKIAPEFGFKSRASMMFAAPLLVLFGQAEMPLPGGDQVGRRPVERHLEGLKALGVQIKPANQSLHFTTKGFQGCHYRFAKNTHTGTETMIMASVRAKGETVLENAALEPEIDDLIDFLTKMGAKIKRLPGRIIKIEGVKCLKGTIHRVISDRNEAVSYACAALGTRGDVIIENIRASYLTAFLTKVRAIGGGVEADDFGVRFFYQKPLRAGSITTAPHPGFMTDWQPLWTTLMTQAQGESRVIETIYEYRFGFVKDLQGMGAKIEFFNPQVKNPDRFYNFNLEDDKPEYFHGAKITGPTPLSGKNLTVTDVRTGATLTLAALIAKGQSTLTGLEHIDRGYENLEIKLKELGAKISRRK
jgi:UDP-N-acetylglucosamine 1-carboxyvinyltransferase